MTTSAHNIEARHETAQVEAMEAALAADPTAAVEPPAHRGERLGVRGESNDTGHAVLTSNLSPLTHPTEGRASCQLPTATFLANLMDELCNRVECMGVCMNDVAEALSGTGGNSAWVQNQCQAAAQNARRAADLFDRIAEHLADPPTAKTLVRRLPLPDRRCLSEAIDKARRDGTELWAVIGEKLDDPEPWKWALLTTQRTADKAATARKNWNAQPSARSTHAVRVV